jgi:hypothetical protein
MGKGPESRQNEGSLGVARSSQRAELHFTSNKQREPAACELSSADALSHLPVRQHITYIGPPNGPIQRPNPVRC